MLLFLESVPDPASRGIAEALRRITGAQETPRTFEGRPVLEFQGGLLATTESLHIHAERIDARLQEAGLRFDAIVFLSKHRSESGRPTLTAHPVGNLAGAEFGGQPGRLSPTNGSLLSQALRALARARDAAGYPFEVSFEATHHGPLLATPAIFLELGSSEAQWADRNGHQVVGAAAARLVEPVPAWPTVIGLGGGHYGPRFTEAALTKQVHFAHMIPTHHAKAVDPESRVPEVIKASPGATGAYYHDGTLPAAVRDRWLAAFQAHGLPAVRSRDWAPYAASPAF